MGEQRRAKDSKKSVPERDETTTMIEE